MPARTTADSTDLVSAINYRFLHDTSAKEAKGFPDAVHLRPVSPSDTPSLTSSSQSSGDSDSSHDGDFSTTNKEIVEKIVMSEHKRAEVSGELLPEPLLIDNPRRFVLFPIEHDDVS